MQLLRLRHRKKSRSMGRGGQATQHLPTTNPAITKCSVQQPLTACTKLASHPCVLSCRTDAPFGTEKTLSNTRSISAICLLLAPVRPWQSLKTYSHVRVLLLHYGYINTYCVPVRSRVNSFTYVTQQPYSDYCCLPGCDAVYLLETERSFGERLYLAIFRTEDSVTLKLEAACTSEMLLNVY